MLAQASQRLSTFQAPLSLPRCLTDPTQQQDTGRTGSGTSHGITSSSGLTPVTARTIGTTMCQEGDWQDQRQAFGWFPWGGSAQQPSRSGLFRVPPFRSWLSCLHRHSCPCRRSWRWRKSNVLEAICKEVQTRMANDSAPNGWERGKWPSGRWEGGFKGRWRGAQGSTWQSKIYSGIKACSTVMQAPPPWKQNKI